MKTVSVVIGGLPGLPGVSPEKFIGNVLSGVTGAVKLCPVQLLKNHLEPTHRLYGLFMGVHAERIPTLPRDIVRELRRIIPDSCNGSFHVSVGDTELSQFRYDEAEDGYL